MRKSHTFRTGIPPKKTALDSCGFSDWTSPRHDLGVAPSQDAVTTRIITFLVGDSELNLHFPGATSKAWHLQSPFYQKKNVSNCRRLSHFGGRPAQLWSPFEWCNFLQLSVGTNGNQLKFLYWEKLFTFVYIFFANVFKFNHFGDLSLHVSKQTGIANFFYSESTGRFHVVNQICQALWRLCPWKTFLA